MFYFRVEIIPRRLEGNKFHDISEFLENLAKKLDSWINFLNKKLPKPKIFSNINKNKTLVPGDSGGPLLLASQQKFYCLLGVITFGDISDQSQLPPVFTRGTFFLEWIQRYIQRLPPHRFMNF